MEGSTAWSLEFGIFLELGVWCLEFRRRRPHDPSRPNPFLRPGAGAVPRVRADSFHANAPRLVLFASGNQTPLRRRALLSLRFDRSKTPSVAQPQPHLPAPDAAARSRRRSGV